MLRVFLLGLILTATTVKSQDYEGSADGDDEVDDEDFAMSTGMGYAGLGLPVTEKYVENKNSDPGYLRDVNGNEDKATTIIIIAAVSLVALAIVAIVAIVLFRRHLQNREQGVYSVPVEQQEKGAV